MAAHGPPRTPTRLLALRGSWRARVRGGEPSPKPEPPPRPAGLSPAAAAVWDDLVPRLDAVGVLTAVDGRVFGRYCEISALWDEIHAFLRKSGHAHPVKNERGEVVGVRAYPQVRLALQVSEHLLRLEQHFGLTPAARARLQGQADAPDDPAESYFSARPRTG